MPRYLALNKPFEVLSQFTDSRGRSTLADFIPFPGIYAAGRLDYRSEGLLILSDDGGFIHRLTTPEYKQAKIYLAQVEGMMKAQALSDLNNRIVLPGLQTKLPEVAQIEEPDIWPRPQPVRDYHPTSWLHVSLVEGKKHQVRRMTAAVGYPTLRLVRLSIGPVTLGDLQPGEWRALSREEVQAVAGSPQHPHSPPSRRKQPGRDKRSTLGSIRKKR